MECLHLREIVPTMGCLHLRKGVPTLSSYISETTAYTMECLHLREGVPTFAYNAKRLPRCSPALLQGVLWGSHHLSMWQEELCQEVLLQ